MIHGDSFEFRVREQIVLRALELRERLDDQVAVAIINRLAESMKKGQSAS